MPRCPVEVGTSICLQLVGRPRNFAEQGSVGHASAEARELRTPLSSSTHHHALESSTTLTRNLLLRSIAHRLGLRPPAARVRHWRHRPPKPKAGPAAWHGALEGLWKPMVSPNGPGHFRLQIGTLSLGMLSLHRNTSNAWNPFTTYQPQATWWLALRLFAEARWCTASARPGGAAAATLACAQHRFGRSRTFSCRVSALKGTITSSVSQRRLPSELAQAPIRGKG